MKLRHLKIIRVIVSIIFLLPLLFLFVEIGNLLSDYSGTILYLQFIPSIIKFIAQPALAVLGFIVVLLLVVIFGRVYCSSICPLGTLQDISSYISNKIKRNQRYHFTQPHNIWRYSILIITFLSIFTGSLIAVNLLDPYSNFGRIISDLVRPAYISVNNLISGTLENYDLFWLNPIELRKLPLAAMAFPAGFFILLLIMSIGYGRLYCNTLCPVGTLLGLLSRFSFFRLVINDEKCLSCGKCEKVCKSNCIDNESHELDFSRCVCCYNCIESCNLDGFRYELQFKKSNPNKSFEKVSVVNTNPSKRKFLFDSVGLFIIFLGTTAKPVKKYFNPGKPTTKPENRKILVVPPGAISLKNFKDRCTGCHLCVAQCPTQVIQPSIFHYSISGILQPMMDYHTSFCNYECTVCSKVCPSGALQALNVEQKKLEQVGISKFIKDNCIVYTNKTECGACSEHCPTKACNMIPEEGLFVPKINEDICIGCGACEFACPTKPYKAIYVEGNSVHKQAQKPPKKKIEKELKPQEDFPF